MNINTLMLISQSCVNILTVKSGTITGMKELKSDLEFMPLGAIFDLDDTLLDNQPKSFDMGLHEHARLLALRDVGEKRGIHALATMSTEMNLKALERAPIHSIYGATWQIFYELGIVGSRTVDFDNELLQEVAQRKNELYEPILQEFGAPVEKALEFVKAMYVLTDGKLAIASGALHEIIIRFLRTSGMDAYFQDASIFGQEDYERYKPDPESFVLAFQSLGLPESVRGRVIAFEDDPKGIASAKSAGLYVAAITTRFDRNTLLAGEPAPDMVAGGFVDFAEALGISL